jgi:hypothetical protein
VTGQAATGFGLIDRAGEYDGEDPDTQTPGRYTYTFTASDPTGQRFMPCTATDSIVVNGDNTPTPTPTATSTATATGTPPTITPTPTNTPTPTPTTTPDGPVVRVNPSNLVIPICEDEDTGSVNVENATNLMAVQLELRYDPATAQVIDTDPGETGVQVTAGSVFSGGFVVENEVDTTNGRISFAATLLGSNVISGNVELISVDWQPLATGNAALTLENILLVNNLLQAVSFTTENGQLQVTNCAGVSGILILQGRTDHSGITVSSASGEQTQTTTDGSFTIGGADSLNFSFPGYLSAQADAQTLAQDFSGAADQPLSLGTLTLLAGDVYADNVIDILDLAVIAKFLGSSDTLTDLNGDGTVNILDLALAATNYGRQGPLTEWR